MPGTIAIIVALIVAALVCFLLEMLTPTFGVLFMLGLGALGGACWAAFALSETAGTAMIIISALLVPIDLALMVKFLPRSPLGKLLFLRRTRVGRGTGIPQAETFERLVGKKGMAETSLRPAGAIRVDGKRYTASAEGAMIEKGAAVKVIRGSGLTLIVRELKEQPPAQAPPEGGTS